jgi:ubiquinone/menaquinone biosynthesis C-methylase UbiE
LKRVSQPEILDGPDLDPREVELSLADLRTVNHFFGGIHTSQVLFDRVVADRKLRELSILDVGSGSGDVPLTITRHLRQRGLNVSLTLFDQHENHLPQLDGKDPSLYTMTGDALNLPFMENWFDVVSCSLLLHHLEPDQARRFVQSALKVARHAVIINDLVRSPLHYSLLHLWRPFFRTRVSYLDGLTSVHRAYTPAEIATMLSGIGRTEITRHYFFRMGIIVWK